MKTKYKSKLFSGGHILLALTLAIRGLARTRMTEEQPVTRNSGWAIYEEEIQLLDRIDPQLRIFQSGVLAAMLMTVAIDPRLVVFWSQVNEERWTRRNDGQMDPASWLLQQILRHSGNCELALRPDYQQYLFQKGLAAAMAARQGFDSGQAVWLTAEPPRVAIDVVIEQVRKSKGLRRAPDGFRPVRALAGRIPTLAQTVIEHNRDINLAERLAATVASMAEYAFDVNGLTEARALLEKIDMPAELAAPGVLAAALVSLVRDPTCLPIWEAVFCGHWSHDPDKGSDIAGLITRSIQFTNRRCEGAEAQAALFTRAMMALKSYARRLATEEDPRARNIPRARPVLVASVLRCWRKIVVPVGPTIHAGAAQIVFKGAAADQIRPACQARRGQSRDRTGRRGETVFERFHARCGLPRPGRLIDRTRDQCGFDYDLEADSEQTCVFEVKTVGVGGFQFTEKQWEVAEALRDQYWLILVHEKSDGEAQVISIQDPFGHFSPRKQSRMVIHTDYAVSARQWRQVVKDVPQQGGASDTKSEEVEAMLDERD